MSDRDRVVSVGATRWRILHVPEGFVNVELTVDTTAPLVVRRIEQAAKNAGITLERVTDDDGVRPAGA